MQKTVSCTPWKDGNCNAYDLKAFVIFSVDNAEMNSSSWSDITLVLHTTHFFYIIFNKNRN